MKVARRKSSSALFALAAVLTMLLVHAQPMFAQTEKVLYSFCSQQGCPDGSSPQGPLIRKGTELYGTTFQGGTDNAGTVFMVSTAGKESVIHSFGSTGDGVYPLAGLIMDKKHNLYGTTENGGTSLSGYGTVFETTTKGAETVLHSFVGSPSDGTFPKAALLMDKEGNLYGTTTDGGVYGYGTVLKISAGGTETILYDFAGAPNDGANPGSALIMDTKGNLYGTTYGGGANNEGTVFALSADGTEMVLHSFANNGTDGYSPVAGLVMGTKTDLFGTTYTGGTFGFGTVFELFPPAKKGGAWSEAILHSFNLNGVDGYFPNAVPIMDKKHNLYGTTNSGGTSGYGTVFELVAPVEKGGAWTEAILHSFAHNTTDGFNPTGGLVMDTKGNLYGTTGGGGTNLHGAVYEVTP